ncbi:KxYKxGKxW signal peptide domain-containing protein [Streptococcus suis]|nr:KxYKxGKxW signal peptide domain-containing protein [Streptococcus suis]
MERKNGKRYTEVSRKSRVKMHKSGKHWVRTVIRVRVAEKRRRWHDYVCS